MSIGVGHLICGLPHQRSPLIVERFQVTLERSHGVEQCLNIRMQLHEVRSNIGAPAFHPVLRSICSKSAAMAALDPISAIQVAAALSRKHS